MLTKLKLLATLLPVLIELIKTVESIIPGNGKGEQKLALVRSMLEFVWDHTTDLGAQWDWIAKLTGSLVAVFNRNGWNPEPAAQPLPVPVEAPPPTGYLGPNLDGSFEDDIHG